MSILRTMPSVAAACGLTLFAVAAVKAQSAAPPPAAPAGHGPQVERGGVMLDRMAHRRLEHLRLIHDALNIRADQEGAWQAFAASMAPSPEMRAHEGMGEGEGDRERLTAPQRMDRMVARMQARLAAVQRHAAAVKALYAALDPTQRRTFDALVALHGMHDMHGMHGMHGGWGMHGGMGGPGPEGMDDLD